MRGLVPLLALMLLAPTASAIGALSRVTPEAIEVTLASVKPFEEEMPERETPPPPAPTPAASVSTSAERPAQDGPPESVGVEMPAGIPLPDLLFNWDDAEVDYPVPLLKVERVETQLAIGYRAPVELPPARLPVTPPAGGFALTTPPASVAPPPAAPPRETRPDEGAPHRVASVEPVGPSGDSPWGAAAAAVGIAIVLVAPFLLYHRLRGARALESEPRARLLQLLREHPGLSPAHAARVLGVDPTTALYHLRRLVKENLAVAEGPRRGARYFAAGTCDADERARVVALEGASDVLAAVESAPGTSKSELAQRLAIARASVTWHLSRLEQAGLVRYERDGRNVRVFPINRG